MGVERYNNFVGLVSDPNPEGVAPNGSLQKLENGMVDRLGSITPRPGVVENTDYTPASNSTFLDAYEYQGKLYASEYDNSTNEAVLRKPLDDADVTINSETVPCDNQSTFFEEAQNSLFVTTVNGVVRIDDETSSTASYAGLPVPAMFGPKDPSTSTSNIRAYCHTFVRELETRTITSAPSNSFVSGLNAGTLDVFIALPKGLKAGDFIDFYHTEVASDFESVSATFNRYARYVITSTDITNGIIEIRIVGGNNVNYVVSNAALYTNATQEGALQANNPPPPSNSLTYHNNIMFYGAQAPENLIAESVGIVEQFEGAGWGGWSDATGESLAAPPIFSVYSTVASYSNKTGTTVTFSGTQPIHPLSYVYEDGTADYDVGDADFAAETRVTSTDWDTSTNTITLDKSVISTGSGTIVAVPSITVNSTPVVAKIGATLTDERSGRWRPAEDSNTATAVHQYFALASLSRVLTNQFPGYSFRFLGLNFFADDTANSSDFDNSRPRPILLVCSRYGKPDTEITSFTFGPVDVVTSGAVAVSATLNTNEKNKLYYSKILQPDSVPSLNFLEIGSADKEILQTQPIRDSLFIFKEDGVWRVTGRSPNQLRLDPYDQTIQLLAPKTVVRHGLQLFAWTNQGVITVSDAGIQNISDQRVDNLLKSAQYVALNNSRAQNIVHMASKQLDDLVYCFASAENFSEDGNAFDIYTFSTKTNSWAGPMYYTTDRNGNDSIYGVAYNETANKLWMLGKNGSTDETILLLERGIDETYYHADEQRTLSIDTIDGENITLAAGTVRDGDVFVQGSAIGVISNDEDDPTFVLKTITGTFTTGSVTVYNSIQTIIKPVEETLGIGTYEKHYQETSISFRSFDKIANLKLSYTSDVSTTSNEIEKRVADLTADLEPRRVRFGIHRAYGRNAHLTPQLTVTGAGKWNLSSMSLEFRPVSNRGAR